MTTESLYEQFYALTAIAKQRFVEQFVGNDIDTGIWTKTQIAGSTGTFAMNTTPNGGYRITSGSTNNNEAIIHFNQKRAFLQTGSILWAIMRSQGLVGVAQYVGLSNVITTYTGVGSRALFVHDTGNTFSALRTADGATSSQSTTGFIIDQTWHIVKIECTSSNILLTQDGSLAITKTTNRPAGALEPMVGAKRLTSIRAVDVRYLEVFNT